jgi:hypothetical protein
MALHFEPGLAWEYEKPLSHPCPNASRRLSGGDPHIWYFPFSPPQVICLARGLHL